MEFKKILIAVDDSALSMKAARTGFALARNIGASVGLLYVVNKSNEFIAPDLGITPEQSKTVLLKEAEDTLEQYIKMFNGVEEVLRFTPEGFPEQEILNIAAEWNADLIVMGSHGRAGLSRLISGSLADHIIRHAGIPVLITPPGMK